MARSTSIPGGGTNPNFPPQLGPRIPGKASVGPPQPPKLQLPEKSGLMPRHAARMAMKMRKGKA